VRPTIQPRGAILVAGSAADQNADALTVMSSATRARTRPACSPVGLVVDVWIPLSYNGIEMERDKKLVFRVPAQMKQALADAAEADGRTMSNLAVYVLSAWLQEHGYLRGKKAKTETRRR